MATTEPGWELYRSFLSVVQQRSLSAAARSLGLTQPTLGRHIDALESALGTSLFTRSQTGLVPTPAAQTLLPHAEAMASAARALARAASGDATDERGVVRITASEMVGAEVLPPLLTDLRRQHPRVDVELVLSNRTQDLSRRDADLAVRMVKPTQASLVTKRLGAVKLGLHAHPGYLQACGSPRDVSELGGHTLVGFDTAASVQRLPKLRVPISRDLFAFRCDHDFAQYSAIRAGFGIGVCQVALAKRDGLVRLLPGVLEFELGVWLVMHKDSKSTRRIRITFDHLALGLARYIASQEP